MTNEVKQRKKTQKQNEEPPVKEAQSVKNDAPKLKAEVRNEANKSTVDLKSILCMLSFVACGALTWAVLQQNKRFAEMEDNFRALNGKTASLFDMEEELLRSSKKLVASEDGLQEALSAVSSAKRLQEDVSALYAAIMAMQEDENSASHDLQTVNARFLNVTETWQERLAAITSDLAALKSESRDAHAGATERVNEAERRARSLTERLEELEHSTRRNARAVERTEEDDAKRAQDQLDWNTKQILNLQTQLSSLDKREAELLSQLQEHIPKAKECETHLPEVEEAVRSILKLGVDLGGAEKRLEDATLQVFGTEDHMLKTLNEILEIRKELDSLQAQNSILRMKNELSVVKEAMRELTAVLRGGTEEEPARAEDAEDEGWMEEAEEDEEWETFGEDDTALPLTDGLAQ